MVGVAGGHAEKLGKCCWNVFLSSHSGWWRLLFYFRCKIMSECACSLTQDPNQCGEYIVLITSLWVSRYPETGSSLEQNQNKPLVTPNNNHISDWSLQPVLRKGVAQQHPSLGKQPGHGQGHSTWTGTQKHPPADPWAQPAATDTGAGALVTQRWKHWNTDSRWAAVRCCSSPWDTGNGEMERYLTQKEHAAFLLVFY